ncbi:hypothetical protein Tco_0319873 [Tanacetum coccineum]
MTPATTTSSLLQNLPNFASLFGFDHRLKALEDNFSEFRQTNQYAEALSSIPSTVEQYLANKMQEAVDVAVQLKYERIREESTTANQQFLDSIDDGMKKIIKEQVKKEVSKIIPKVEKFVTDRLESEVLVRSSKEANTSHAVAANLSELELKKILIDKMEANNSINRSDIQRQLYKDLVEAYEADKILLDTYGDTVTIKRPRDGADDDEEPSAGTDRGSKRRRSGKEPASTSAPSETTTKTAGKTTSTGSKTHTKSASQSAPVGDAMHSTDVFKGPADQEFETGVQDEQAEEEVQHLPDWFQKPTRLPSPDHAWNTSVPAVHETVQPWLSSSGTTRPRESFDELTDSTFDFSAFVLNRLNVQTLTPELLAGPTFELMKGTCKSLTELEYFCEEVEIVEWHDYKHLDWITVRRDDDVLYKFKEGDFHRLRIQDIEDMLLLSFYQKKLNITKPDTYRSNLRRQGRYTPYSDPRGFHYENKDKKNRLMRIDELHKFSDGTLDDVRTALNDRLKGIRMEYLPQTFWSQRDKANARAMIQAIDKRLKTRRIMRSLERFVGGRPYGGYVVLDIERSADTPYPLCWIRLTLFDVINDQDEKIRIDYAYNLKFSCMIGFELVHANFFQNLPINVMSKKFYNSIMNDKIEFRGRNKLGNFANVPIFVGKFYVISDFIVVEDMKPYLDEGMGDIVVGEPFCKASCVEAKSFNGIITIRDGDDSVTYQMVRGNPRFKHLTNEQRSFESITRLYSRSKDGRMAHTQAHKRT